MDRRRIGAVGRHRFPRRAWIVFHPPERIGAGVPHPQPRRMAEELSVGQARHAGTERRRHLAGRRYPTRGMGPKTGAERHVRAVLRQRRETRSREGARAATGPGHAKFAPVGRGVGRLQTGAVRTDRSPVPIPRPLAGGSGNRPHRPRMRPARRYFSKPAARPRNPALARHPDRLGAPRPAPPFQQNAQHLACARTHVERRGNGVIDHHRCRQVALAFARLAGFRQHLAHPFGRHGPGDHPKADRVAQTRASREAGRNTGHRRQSRITKPAAHNPYQPK